MVKHITTTQDRLPSAVRFKPVHLGTLRYEILRRMDGRQTLDEIGKAVKRSGSLVRTGVFCMWRDCGIGYSLDERGRIKARFPKGRSFRNAVVLIYHYDIPPHEQEQNRAAAAATRRVSPRLVAKPGWKGHARKKAARQRRQRD